MTHFTDVMAALEEAEYCAELEDRAQAIDADGAGYAVVPAFMARFRRLRVLETVSHVEDAA